MVLITLNLMKVKKNLCYEKENLHGKSRKGREKRSFLCTFVKCRQQPDGFGNLLFADYRRHTVAVLRAIASKSCMTAAFEDVLLKHRQQIVLPLWRQQSQEV